MWWIWLALWLPPTPADGSACGVAELPCRSGRCVPLDAYCDGLQQCGDGSDEPPNCTPCNRTYYGRAGRGYELALPAAPRLPFLCHLTFTAGGGAHGELVQLGFEEFHVGRYEPGALDGCPDGYVQLAELGRPFTGGSWCGEAAGAAIYYSETATVTLSLRLYRLRVGEPFALRLHYKFLAARDAVVRFGSAVAPLERGAVSPGTYCTRTYEECHRRPCRLQSPNYPGMYPRNVTCYWSLRQKDIPTCKHAMISVRQDHSHKMQIKRSISMASLNKTGRAVRAWRECTGERDRLIVYDGGSTDDPVLLTYCGGDWLPPVTSRGPDMLVAFHSSPYSAPPRASATAAPLRGFELDVAVVFADSDSLEYAREPRRCEFHVKASSDDGRGRRGVLHAPRHTLPPDTTCTWTFHGRPGDVVWIYFASYTQYSLVEPRREAAAERDDGERDGGDSATERATSAGSSDASPWARLRQLLRARPSLPPSTSRPTSCSTSLRVWDGGSEGEPGATLVGRYCDEAPALCARASLANATRAPRACAPPDGYVSRGPLLALAVTTRPGTATHPLQFALHYEFVDARLPGEPLPGRRSRPTECARVVTVEGEVGSPRNVLWFGRGGARRLRCVLRLEAGVGRAELRLTELGFGRRERCTSRPDPRTGRLACVPYALDPPDTEGDLEDDTEPTEEDEVADEDDVDIDTPLRVPHLWIYESPWPGYRVPVACVCDNSSVGLVVVGGGALELELRAPALSVREDARHVQWAGSWRRLPATPCAARRAPPPGGHVALRSTCEAPLLLATRGNRSLFLRVWGEELPPAPPTVAADPPPCHTTNRVLVYDPYSARLLKAVCPGDMDESARTVQMFTAEWWGGRAGAMGAPALAVVWAQREAGAARLAWMEAWRGGPALMTRLRAHLPDADNASLVGAAAACEHACPELEACADASLWCDGASDCPRGGDEAGGCGAARLLAVLRGWRAAGWAGALLGALAALFLVLLLALRRRWARSLHKHPLDAPVPRRLTQEPLLDSRSPSASS